MSDWKFLGKYAITTYPSNAPREYVVVGRNVVGYAEQGEDNEWSYYHFGPQQKGSTAPPESILKSTGKTAEEAVELGFE